MSKSQKQPARTERPARPRGQFETPADPADTNYDHPVPAGTRAIVPGAGVVDVDDDASPKENLPDRGGAPEPHPGRPVQARREGQPRGHTRQPGDGGAPLSVPRDSVGPQPEAPHLPELTDPNYSAATRRATHEKRQPHPGPAPSVGDVMSRDLDYCTPETNVQYVARMMADKDVGSIPVVDNTDRMVPIGVVTDRDITVRVVAKGQDPFALRADQCMSVNVVTIRDDAPLDEAVMLMERRQLRRLPVVDDAGRLVGMLAQADVALAAPRQEAGELVRKVSQQ